MRRQFGPDDAQDIAIRALGFIASDDDRLGRFLSITGLGPDNLRNAARDPSFLASVLDHIAEDESLLLAFAAEACLKPENVAAAHRLMSGPAEALEP